MRPTVDDDRVRYVKRVAELEGRLNRENYTFDEALAIVLDAYSIQKMNAPTPP